MSNRKYIFVVIIALIGFVYTCAACSADKTDKLSGIVVMVDMNSIIIAVRDAEETDLVAVSTDTDTKFILGNTAISRDDIESGKIVEIVYDGYLMATSPAQTNPVVSIAIVGEATEDAFADAQERYNNLFLVTE